MNGVGDVGWKPRVDSFWHDAAYALRSFGRSPGFTAVAVLTLAIGIGATTAIFSLVSAVLLTPLPYKESARVVRLMMNAPASESPSKRPLRAALGLSAAEIAEVRAQATALSHVGTASGLLRGLRGKEEGARLQGARVSTTIFDMIEARPALGRVFVAADESAGAEPVIILSHTAWQRFLGGAPNIIGTIMTMDSTLGPRIEYRYTIIGVMPEGFEYPDGLTLFWVPFQAALPPSPPVRGPLVGRLADGVSIDAATAQIGSLLRAMRPEAPQTRYELVYEQREMVQPVKLALLVLMAAVAFVLLIACVNVANLMIARSAARQREMAIRIAIGAGRGRLIRQTLTESLILALLGGIAGTAVAIGGVGLLKELAATMTRIDLAPTSFPRIESATIDLQVLGFTIACCLAIGVLFGLLPAIQHSHLDPVRALKSGDPTASRRASVIRPNLRQVLVVAEVTLAMVLLVGSGLLVRSFMKLSTIDPGYDAENVLTFQVSLPGPRYSNAQLRSFAERVIDRLRLIPGVEAAAYANQLPMVNLTDTAGGLWATPDPARLPSPIGPDARFVSRDYLKVFGIRVVSGRGFSDDDGEGRRPVLLVNQALVASQFAGENPIGRTVFVGRDVVPWEIVGVVEDVRQVGLDRAPAPQFFADLRQWSGSGPFFPVGAYYAVRATADPQQLVASIRAIVNGLDQDAALFNVAPMTALVANSVARPRLYAVLVGAFAAAGAALALIGIYGVMAYSVTQRTREIGIRMSLGAERKGVLRLVLLQSLALTAIGVVLGVAGAAALGRYVETLLFGVTPLDGGTFVSVATSFFLVAALASYLPARRAANVDPLVAIRCE